MHRGLCGLPCLPRLGEQLKQLMSARGTREEELIEGICVNTVAELARQSLTDRTDAFLLAHCDGLMRRIQDPALRQTHFMEE